MLHIGKITFFEVFETYFPTVAPILGNKKGSHYVLFVHWVSTNLIGIGLSRNKRAEVVKKIIQILFIRKIKFFEVWDRCFPLVAPILGNVIETHCVNIVARVSTYLIGIAISRN